MSSAAPVGLTGITRFAVRRALVDLLQVTFRAAGRSGSEAVGFWAGRVRGETFEAAQPIFPRQEPVRGADGSVGVVIPGEELFRMNVWLYRNGLELGAQVHSHPGAAYHSDTDDEYAVMARAGGLSIVVPDFAAAPFALDTAAVYRLGMDGSWRHLAAAEVSALIHIV